MNYTVQTLDNISKKGLKLLDESYKVVDKKAENPDSILVRSTKMHDMDIPESVKFIGRAGAGVNNIPLEKCCEQGIVVCNSPGANANAVKELVALGLLLSSRKVYEGIDWLDKLEKNDDIAAKVEKGKKAFAGPELYGKKMGVIGLGAIGVMVANMAVDFGMKVYGFDPYLSIDHAWGLSRKVKRSSSREAIFKNCDYVSLHIPFMDSTKDYVDAEVLKQAKKGIRLMNFARGGLVNNEALKEAIEKGIVAKYVVDFPNNETAGMPGVINIPHLGASTPESEEKCAIMAVEALKEYMETGNIINSVNFPNCSLGECDNENRICVCHRNVKNMIGQIAAVIAEYDINISDMTNKNRGDWAYTIIDVDHQVSEAVENQIKSIEGVTRVRIIR